MARFLRAFPAYTAEAALAMPAIRFWALYGTIGRLDAADDLRALLVAGHAANPGKNGHQLTGFATDLEWRSRHMPGRGMRGPGVSSDLLVAAYGATVAEPGSVSGLRARQMAQVAEQREAYEAGGWDALAEVLRRQRAENVAATGSATAAAG
ncbi:MAG: hypothetical protein KDE23_13495 [Caldilinea sp.]|nr:hypothetical protein [Caldilinea sp.]